MTRDVYTHGYKQGKVPVVRAELDTLDRNIKVLDARNADDKTKPSRLHLNEVLRALWEKKGLELSQLRPVEFSDVTEEKTLAEIKKIRKKRRLRKDASFRVSEPAAGEDGAEWTALFQSPFGKVARRVANEGGNLVDKFEIRGEVWSSKVNKEYLTVEFS